VVNSVAEFLEEATKSPIRRELLNFFYENQFAMDTAKNLSRWINKDLEEVEKDLEGLVKLKVLEKIGEGSSAIYSYTQDLETINMIERFIKITRGEEKYG
jgi:Fic family protein